MSLLRYSDKFLRAVYAQKELEKETRQVSLGWTSDTVNVHIDAS